MVGGLMKYVMAIIIVVPGIALFGILGQKDYQILIWLFHIL